MASEGPSLVELSTHGSQDPGAGLHLDGSPRPAGAAAPSRQTSSLARPAPALMTKANFESESAAVNLDYVVVMKTAFGLLVPFSYYFAGRDPNRRSWDIADILQLLVWAAIIVYSVIIAPSQVSESEGDICAPKKPYNYVSLCEVSIPLWLIFGQHLLRATEVSLPEESPHQRGSESSEAALSTRSRVLFRRLAIESGGSVDHRGALLVSEADRSMIAELVPCVVGIKEVQRRTEIALYIAVFLLLGALMCLQGNTMLGFGIDPNVLVLCGVGFFLAAFFYQTCVMKGYKAEISRISRSFEDAPQDRTQEVPMSLEDLNILVKHRVALATVGSDLIEESSSVPRFAQFVAGFAQCANLNRNTAAAEGEFWRRLDRIENLELVMDVGDGDAGVATGNGSVTSEYYKAYKRGSVPIEEVAVLFLTDEKYITDKGTSCLIRRAESIWKIIICVSIMLVVMLPLFISRGHLCNFLGAVTHVESPPLVMFVDFAWLAVVCYSLLGWISPMIDFYDLSVSTKRVTDDLLEMLKGKDAALEHSLPPVRLGDVDALVGWIEVRGCFLAAVHVRKVAIEFVLGYFMVSVVAILLGWVFFARQDTWSPGLLSAVSVGLTIFFLVMLPPLLFLGTRINGVSSQQVALITRMGTCAHSFSAYWSRSRRGGEPGVDEPRDSVERARMVAHDLVVNMQLDQGYVFKLLGIPLTTTFLGTLASSVAAIGTFIWNQVGANFRRELAKIQSNIANSTAMSPASSPSDNSSSASLLLRSGFVITDFEETVESSVGGSVCSGAISLLWVCMLVVLLRVWTKRC